MTRAFQPDDLLDLHFLTGAALSPDVSKVLYTVNKICADNNKEYSTLFLLDRATGETRQMTGGRCVDAEARWSPDGKTIAFISNRDGEPQLYLLPADGGEARQLTRFKRGAGGGLAWSPDSGKIAFCAKPDAEAADLSHEPYRVDRTVYRFDGMGYLDDEVNDIFVIDLASDDITRMTDDRSHNSNPRWSPNGRGILYDASFRPDAASVMAPDLKIVDLSGKQSTILADWSRIESATFTPDGARIVFVGRPDDGKPIGAKYDLFTLDLSSGDIECRTNGLDVGVGGMITLDMPVGALGQKNLMLSPAGESAYVTVQSGGTNHVYRVALSGAQAFEPVTSGESVDYALDLLGDQLLFARTTLNAPPDLHLLDLAGGSSQRLTQLNADFLGALALPQTQRLAWRSVDGVDVEGWYMKPPTGEAPYPTILYIHGGPHRAFGYGFHFDFQMLAGAGYGVLFLNHRASTGYGDSFSTAIKGDWGNLDYQDSDERRRLTSSRWAWPMPTGWASAACRAAAI